MSDYMPQDGDYVRVVAEGTVDRAQRDGSFYLNAPSRVSWYIAPEIGPVVSVERIESPHTDPEFVPGMVVRNADDLKDRRRWAYDGDVPSLCFVQIAPPTTDPDEKWCNRAALPTYLAVAYDPRQDTP